MAVSYLSSPVQDNPYVLPVDINLLAKVNQYKQSIFYQNADKVGDQLSQLNNTDILKDNERDYLKNKVNNLTTGINDMGGIDYSDMNVANSIENYASDIYKDPTILTAITSTKNVRQYLQNTQDMKDDPKLAKYYDPAREWYDTQNPLNQNSIINYKNSKFGAAYSGPTAPAPYLGNDFDLLSAAVTKLHPNITESFSPSGNRFFIDKQTNTEVPPEQIRAMVDGQIDGKVSDQLNVHAAYNYYALSGGKYSKQDGINEYVGNAQNLLNNANARVATLQHDITVEGDLTKRAQLQSQLDDVNNNYIPQYQKAITNGTSDFSKLWDNNQQSALYTLYKNKLTNDVVGAYSYNQTKHQLVVNQEAVYNSRVELEAAKQGKVVKWNTDGSFTFGDPTAPDTVPDNTLSVMGINKEASADLEKDKISQQSLLDENDAINQDLNTSLSTLIQKSARHTGATGLINYNTSQIANDPNAKSIVHPDLLKQIGMLTGDSNISPDDIQAVLNMNSNGGTVNANGIPQVNPQGNKNILLTPDQVSYFKNVLDVIKRGADSEDIRGKISDAGEWQNYLHNYSIQHNVIAYNNNLIQSAHNQVMNSASSPLTASERDAVNKYTANPSAYYKTQSQTYQPFGSTSGPSTNNVPVFTGDAIMKSGLDKLGGVQNVNSKMDDLIGKTATRNNYYNVVLPDSKKTLGEQYPALINYITAEQGKNENPDKNLVIKKKEDISANSIVTDGKDYYVGYNDASDLTKGTGYAKIEPQDLTTMGIHPLPYPFLEKVGSGNGRLMEPIYVNPAITDNKFNIDNGITSSIAIQATNMGSNALNDNTYEPSIVYQGKEYFYKGGSSKTMNGAIERMTRFIQDNKTFTSLSDMVKTLQIANNQ